MHNQISGVAEDSVRHVRAGEMHGDFCERPDLEAEAHSFGSAGEIQENSCAEEDEFKGERRCEIRVVAVMSMKTGR